MNVLVIDNDDTHAWFISRAAESLGLNITQKNAESRSEAMTFLLQGFNADLIFIDVEIPGDQTSLIDFINNVRENPALENICKSYIVVNSYHDFGWEVRGTDKSPQIVITTGANEFLYKEGDYKNDQKNISLIFQKVEKLIA